MRTESATNAKNHFGEIMDAALREPVMIQRSGRNSVVMLSAEDYKMLEALSDRLWGEKAKEAEKESPIGVEETTRFFESIMNAKD
ncbi:MAG: type II toxin-antitoxin system Phd/YefM family antitoxin [Rickettsiales bacterium]